MARFVTKEQSKQTQSNKILEYKQLFYLFTFFLMYVLTWRHQASPSHHSVAKWGSSFLRWLPPTPSSPVLILTSSFFVCVLRVRAMGQMKLKFLCSFLLRRYNFFFLISFPCNPDLHPWVVHLNGLVPWFSFLFLVIPSFLCVWPTPSPTPWSSPK